MELKQIARKVVSAHPGATAREAAELMADAGAAAMVILDGDALVGILSARDVVERVVAKRLDPEKTLVSEIMTPRVQTITEGTSIRDVVDRMEGQCRHLPLVDADGRVTGMLTMGYLPGRAHRGARPPERRPRRLHRDRRPRRLGRSSHSDPPAPQQPHLHPLREQHVARAASATRIGQ